MTSWKIFYVVKGWGKRDSLKWLGSTTFYLYSLKRFYFSTSSFISHCFPSSLPLSPIFFFPGLCSMCIGVEPLYRRGILGRTSKAFITGFAALLYAGKCRATHAWPLTSLWSSAIHERRVSGPLIHSWFYIVSEKRSSLLRIRESVKIGKQNLELKCKLCILCLFFSSLCQKCCRLEVARWRWMPSRAFEPKICKELFQRLFVRGLSTITSS